VLEIDVLLFSESVEIDSGEWRLAGDSPESAPLRSGRSPGLGGRTPEAAPRAVDPDVWRSYRSAFDEEALT
jgi:hypothetical protein